MVPKSIYKILSAFTIALFLSSCANNEATSTSAPSPISEANQKEGDQAALVVNFDSEQVAYIKKLIKNYQKEDNAIDPERIFRERCAICHGVKGNLGVNGAGDLTKSSLDLTDRVATIYYGKNTMTPFKEVLSDEEIVELALYVALLRQP